VQAGPGGFGGAAGAAEAAVEVVVRGGLEPSLLVADRSPIPTLFSRCAASRTTAGAASGREAAGEGPFGPQAVRRLQCALRVVLRSIRMKKILLSA